MQFHPVQAGKMPLSKAGQVRELMSAPEARTFRDTFDEHTVKGALLALMRERGADPNRPRVNSQERKMHGDQPMTRLGYVGMAIHEMAEEVTKMLGRHVGGHEIVHCLYDLQKLGFVTFRTSKNPRLARRRGGDESPNHGGGNVGGNGIPVNIKLTPRALAMTDDQIHEVVHEQDVKELADRREVDAVVADLMNGAAMAEAEASVALDLEGGAITAKPGHPALVAALMMTEAAASVALDRDPDEGTHFIGDGHPHETRVTVKPEALLERADVLEAEGRPLTPAMVEARTVAGLPPTLASTYDAQEPPDEGLRVAPYDRLLLARDYPAIWALLGQEDKVLEAVRLLRLAGQDAVADLAEEQLAKRTPLEQQVASLIEELTEQGHIRR